MPEDERTPPPKRQSSPVALSRGQRWVLGGGALVAFALAAVVELWRANDGVGVVSLVIVAAVLGTLAAVGSVPMRFWWGDKGLEFATEDEADEIERDIKAAPPEQAEAILDKARTDSSPVTRAAARRVEDKIERGKQMARSATGDVAESLKKLDPANILWVTHNSAFAGDFQFKSDEGGTVYGFIVYPTRDESFSPREHFSLVSGMSAKDSLFFVVSELDDAWQGHHVNMVKTYEQVARPGVKLVTCPWSKKSIDVAVEYLYTGAVAQSDGDSAFYSYLFPER